MWLLTILDPNLLGPRSLDQQRRLLSPIPPAKLQADGPRPPMPKPRVSERGAVHHNATAHPVAALSWAARPIATALAPSARVTSGAPLPRATAANF